MVATVLAPTQYSLRRGWRRRMTTARAATSGWYIGGTGCGCRGSRERTQENWGVLTAGICTTVTLTRDPSCSSSQRSDAVNPLMACFAPQ